MNGANTRDTGNISGPRKGRGLAHGRRRGQNETMVACGGRYAPQSRALQQNSVNLVFGMADQTIGHAYSWWEISRS